jgi:hypothetical protein
VAVLAVVALTGCDDPIAPEDVLSRTLTSDHYVFRMAPGDSVDVAWQEAYFDWVSAELQVVPADRLEYFKYRDRAHMQEVTGRATNGFAEPGTPRFHTIWPIDNHEGVHTLVILGLGHPPALFNEGVAVAHHTSPATGDFVVRWSGQDVHDIVRGLIGAGAVPAVEDLIESPDFFSDSENLRYPLAGSFVRWLLDEHGLAPFRALLDGAAFDQSAAVTLQRFQQAYGLSLSDAWDAWLAWLVAPPSS